MAKRRKRRKIPRRGERRKFRLKESGGQSDLRELIARRAYEIYEERGRCDGDDLNDWLRAEAEVKSALRPRSVALRRRASKRASRGWPFTQDLRQNR